VTGRTESDPAAECLARNIVKYAESWRPAPRREALYVGKAAARRHLEFSGIALGSYEGGTLAADRVLVVGQGGGPELARNKQAVAAFLNGGGQMLALGLDAPEANAFLPFPVTMKHAEHIATYFEPSGRESLLVGIGPADVHNRTPRELPLVAGGLTVLGNGILAKAEDANVVFCQLIPQSVTNVEQYSLRRTYRRFSFTLTRLLANMGVAAPTPILERFRDPVTSARPERRWLGAFYLDEPIAWDDPYRFFNW
jgi:hypothetical protein